MTDSSSLPPRRSSREAIVLALWLLPVAIVYAVAALRNHAHYGTTGFDLAIFDQGLWHASRFESMTSTVRQLPSILGDHFHPALLLLTPLYWFGDGTRNLLVAQPVVALLGAFPIFAMARRRMPVPPATLLAMAYALSWGIGRGLGFDFHELALAAPALAWTIDRFDARNTRGFWIAAVVLLLTKEDQSLTFVVFGVLAWSRRDGIRAGLAPVVVGLAWFLVATRVAMPYFSEGRGYEHWLYSYLAPTPVGLLIYLLSHPVRALGLLVTPPVKLSLWIKTFGSFAFLPILSPYALLAVPSLLMRVLSPEEVHWYSLFHYSMPMMTVMAFASADALGRLEPRFSPRRSVLLPGALLAFLVSAIVYRGSVQFEQWRHPRLNAEAARDLDRLLATIPPDASVTADNTVAPHLSKRVWILLAADEKQSYRTDYYAIDPAQRPTILRLAERLGSGREYEAVGQAGATILYRRRLGVASDLPARPQDLPSYIPKF